MFVKGARDDLLARTGLARDQHADDGPRQAPDGAEHLLHRGAVTNEAMARGGLRLAGNALAAGQGAADDGQYLLQVEGLGDVIEDALLEGGDRLVEVGKAGDCDHRDVAPLVLQRIQHGQAIGIREPDVRDDDPGFRLQQGFLDLADLGKGPHFVARPL